MFVLAVAATLPQKPTPPLRPLLQGVKHQSRRMKMKYLIISILLFSPLVKADLIEICEYEGTILTVPTYTLDKVQFKFLVSETSTEIYENEYGVKFNQICRDNVGEILNVSLSFSGSNKKPAKSKNYNLIAVFSNGSVSMFSFSEKNA